MNIQTIADNLRNTIAGKEIAYNEWRREQSTVGDFACKMLEININELKRILQDVEQCRPDWTPHNCPYAATETCHRMD